MTDAMLSLTGERLKTAHDHLTILSGRALTADAEGLAFSLLYLIKPAVEEFNAVGKKIDADLQVAREMADSEDKLAAIQAIRARQQALFERPFEVKRPKTRLDVKHLPIERKGVDGNNVANAAIRHALTPEFFEPPKEDE